MSRRTIARIALLTAFSAAPLVAQQQPARQQPAQPQRQVAAIDPGMTRAQVVERLGEPLSSRSYESFTYLLYRNGCEKKCGMNDLVVLDSGKVVDAVFRSAARKYTGASSSPKMIDADAAKRGSEAATPRAPMKVPAKPDVKPPAHPKKPA